MNILLWILQALLAVHTAIGGVWKFMNSVEETMPTLSAIPHGAWLAIGAFDLLLAVALIVPGLSSSLRILVPIAALLIVAEMLVFSGLHFASGHPDHSPIVYWSVVALVAAFIAFGRLVLKP